MTEDDLKEESTFIIIHETVLESFLVDCTTVGFLIVAALVGVYFDSEPLQWVGIMLGLIVMILRWNRLNRMSIAEARAELDRIEAKFLKDKSNEI